MITVSEEKWRSFNCFFPSGRAKDVSAPLYMLLLPEGQADASLQRTLHICTCIVPRGLKFFLTKLFSDVPNPFGRVFAETKQITEVNKMAYDVFRG
jgi:hypothetical protein